MNAIKSLKRDHRFFRSKRGHTEHPESQLFPTIETATLFDPVGGWWPGIERGELLAQLAEVIPEAASL